MQKLKSCVALVFGMVLLLVAVLAMCALDDGTSDRAVLMRPSVALGGGLLVIVCVGLFLARAAATAVDTLREANKSLPEWASRAIRYGILGVFALVAAGLTVHAAGLAHGLLLISWPLAAFVALIRYSRTAGTKR